MLKFKVCKSVHHHTIQINHQLDATISLVYHLTFIYSSTCFGHPHAHHQELNNCSRSLWFYLRSVVIAVLLVVIGPAGLTTTNSTYDFMTYYRESFNKYDHTTVFLLLETYISQGVSLQAYPHPLTLGSGSFTPCPLWRMG